MRVEQVVLPQQILAVVVAVRRAHDGVDVLDVGRHAAYHGYSHLSGIEMTSSFNIWNHWRFLTPADAAESNGFTPCSRSHMLTSKK